MNLYDTKKNNRYDVMKKIKDEGYTYNPEENTGDDTTLDGNDTYNAEETTSSSKKEKNNDMIIVLLNAIVVGVATGIVIKYNSYRFNKLEEMKSKK